MILEAYPRRFAASLLLIEESARPRSGNFIQNASKFDYFIRTRRYGYCQAHGKLCNQQPLVRSVLEAYLRRFAVRLLLDEAIARPRSGKIIQYLYNFYYTYQTVTCHNM
jgi:hypothetical protein